MTDQPKAASEAPTFAVGQETEAYCTRCKQDTYHTVVAMVGDKAKQVACCACNDWHRYSVPRGINGPPVADAQPARRKVVAASTGPRRGRGRVKAAPISSAAAADLWREALEAAPGPPQEYDYRGGYAVGDVVQHPKFGLCVVQKKESPRRAIVLCKDGEKALLTPGARKR